MKISRFPLFLVPMIWAPALRADVASDEIALGQAALAESDLATARTHFDNALTADPGNPQASVLLGLSDLYLTVDTPAFQALLTAIGLSAWDIDLPAGQSRLIWAAEETALNEFRALAKWKFTTADSFDGEDALTITTPPLTALDPYFFSTTVSTEVNGPGTLTFDWKLVDPGQLTSALYFWQESGAGQQATAEGGWENLSVAIPAGTQRITWEFHQSLHGPDGISSAFLDHVRFLPEGATDAEPDDDASDEVESISAALDNGDFSWSIDGHEEYSGPSMISLVQDDFESAELWTYLETEFLPRLDEALSRLAVVDDTAFTVDFPYESGGGGVATLDYGDILFMRTLGLSARTLILELLSNDLDVRMGLVNELIKFGLTDPQTLLTVFPDVLRRREGATLLTAETALREAATLYFDASAFIRARTDDTVGIFTLDGEELANEAEFRDDLTRFITALDAPEVFGNTNFFAGALFDSSVDFRELLPTFEVDTPVEGTFPDATFGGLLPDLTIAELEAALADDDGIFFQPGIAERQFAPGEGAANGRGRDAEVVDVDVSGRYLLLTPPAQTTLPSRDLQAAQNPFQLLDRETGTIQPIGVDDSGEPLDYIYEACLSGNGQYAIIAARHAPWISPETQPAEVVEFFEHPVVWPLPENGLEGPRTTVSLAPAQPNGGRYDSTVQILATAEPEIRNAYIYLELETPEGVTANARLYFNRSGRETAFAEILLPPGTSLSGDWKLNLLTSSLSVDGETENPPAIRAQVTLLADRPPIGLFRIERETGAHELLTFAPGDNPILAPSIDWISTDSSGDWVSFLSDSDLTQVATGQYETQAYLLNVPSAELRVIGVGDGPDYGTRITGLWLSDDGKHCAVTSKAPVSPIDTDAAADTYLYDWDTNRIQFVSDLDDFDLNPYGAYAGAVSPEGDTVIFEAFDAFASADISPYRTLTFIRDLDDDSTTCIQYPDTIPDSFADVEPGPMWFSADGHSVYFASQRNLLRLAGTTSGIYRYSRATKSLEAVDTSDDDADRLILPGLATGSGELIVQHSDRPDRIDFLDTATQEIEPHHLFAPLRDYVAMEQPGLYLTGAQVSVGLPVTWIDAPSGETESLTVHLETRGHTAVKWRDFFTHDLSVTLTADSPTATAHIPLGTQAFTTSLGIFEVYLDHLDGPSQIGYPRSTMVVLEQPPQSDRYEAWLQIAFPDPTDRDDPAISGPLADPDRDALPNLLECALGLDPLDWEDPAAPIMPATFDESGVPDSLTLRYNTESGLRVFLEYATALGGSWTRVAVDDLPVLESTQLTDTLYEVRVAFAPATAGERFFYRWRVDLAK